MKQFVIYTLVLIAFISVAYSSKAQPPKAFEAIEYIATGAHVSFYLDYADGYILASRIKMINSHHKPIVFVASGHAIVKGMFYLQSQGAQQKSQIVLSGILEDREAPELIRATYKSPAGNISFTFRKLIK